MSEPRSVGQIESDIAVARDRLAGTIDELAMRAAPKEIARRQVASARVTFDSATRTEDGELRVERVAAIGAAVAALLLLIVLGRRRNRG